jgi:hypothetical protein
MHAQADQASIETVVIKNRETKTAMKKRKHLPSTMIDLSSIIIVPGHCGLHGSALGTLFVSL